MSIIQNIRERGTWIILGLISIALIAFILQDGVGRKQGANDSTTLGEVNGQIINKIEFEQKLEQQLQQYANQGVNKTQLVPYLWNIEVDKLLIKSEAEKLGITVANKEVDDVLFGEESPFKQQFTDKTTGLFNEAAARNALSELKKLKTKEAIQNKEQVDKQFIDPAFENRIINKYQVLINRGIQLPKWLAQKQYAESNTITSINYVGVPYTSIADSTIKVSNDEIAAYIKENSAAYQVEEDSRNISFIGFSAAPVKSDSLNALNEINALKEGFKTTTDAAGYLNKVSTEIPYFNGYLSKKILQIPQKDSVLNVGVGNIYGPYIDGKNYTIAKVIGIKQLPDSSTVRHIFIATNNPQAGAIRDDSASKKLIDSISGAIKSGASFEALCQKYSDDADSKTRGGNLGALTQTQNLPLSLNNFVFENNAGTKGVVKTDYGYHYVEIIKQTPRGPAYNIAYLSKAIIPSTETTTAASTEAAKFASASKDAKSFNANAVKLNKQIIPANKIKAIDYEIQGLGETRQTVRWIFDNNVNTVSEPFEIGDAYIVALITGEDKKGLASVETAKPQVEGIIRDQKKAEKIKASFKGNNLEAIAASVKAVVQKADSLTFTSPLIPGVGNEPKLIGAAFNKSLVNKVSQPIAGNAGVFVLSVGASSAKQAQQDLSTFTEEQLGRLRSIVFRGSTALKKAAKIVDNRAKLL